MANLSKFNQFKLTLGDRYSPSPEAHAHHKWASFYQTDEDIEFYKFSFESRQSAELDHKLYSNLLKHHSSDTFQISLARFYQEQNQRLLYKDALLAGHLAQAKKYAQLDNNKQITAPSLLLIDDRYYIQLVTDFISCLCFLNAWRVKISYSRNFWINLWRLIAGNDALNNDEILLSIGINLKCLADLLQILNIFTLVLFACRLLSQLGLLIHHLRCPSTHHKSIDFYQLLNYELMLRMPNISNDLIWFGINLLSNYPSLWGISLAAANILAASGLAFDALIVVVLWNLKAKELQKKEAELQALIAAETLKEAKTIHRLMLSILMEEIFEINLKFFIQFSAFSLIFLRFLLLISSPAMIISPVGLGIGLLSLSLLTISEKLAAFCRAYWTENQIDKTSEINQKSKELIIEWIKGALLPILLIGLYPINFSIALSISLLYAAYLLIPSPEILSKSNSLFSEKTSKFEFSPLAYA